MDNGAFLCNRAYETGEPSASGLDLLRWAPIRYAAIFDHVDDIGLTDQAGPVAGQDGGSSGHESIERGNDGGFRVGFNAAGGFVQEENGRVCEKGTRNADSLPLTAAEPHAPFANFSVISAGKF